VDKILKRQQIRAEGRLYKLKPIPFDPVFTRADIHSPKLPAFNDTKKSVIEIESGSEKEPETDKERDEYIPPPKKRKRKPDSVRSKKRKVKDDRLKDSTNGIKWNQDPRLVAAEMYKSGWRVQMSDFGNEKVTHWMEPTPG